MQNPIPVILTYLISCFLLVGCSNRPNKNLRAIDERVSETKRLPPVFADDSMEILTHRMSVKNIRDGIVRFTQVRQTCACMGGAKLGKMQLEPGEETTLDITLDLRQRKGRQRFACYLLEENGAEWVYAIESTIHQRAQFAEEPIYFGMVEPGGKKMRETEFILRAETAESLPKRVSFRSMSDHLQVEIGLPRVENEPDGTSVQRIPLTIYVHASTSPGFGHGTILADLLRNGASKDIQCGITWNVSRVLTVSPEQLYFGILSPSSEKIRKKLTIQRQDGKDLQITDVTSNVGGLSLLRQSPLTRSSIDLSFELQPNKVTKAFMGEVVVKTNHADQPILRIPVAAILKINDS